LTVKAVARRREGFAHDVEIDGHTIQVDEPEEAGGSDLGPSPTRLLLASLASCTAITIEMYANRKGWEIGSPVVEVERHASEPGEPARFTVTLHLPKDLDPDQVERLREIAGKCPVHRTLSGEVEIEERVELVGV
jgi:putative redox protein